MAIEGYAEPIAKMVLDPVFNRPRENGRLAKDVQLTVDSLKGSTRKLAEGEDERKRVVAVSVPKDTGIGEELETREFEASWP